MKYRHLAFKLILAVSIFSGTALSGCDKATYPGAKVTEAIKEICAKEYHIQNVEVKFSGKTIGVFLPLKKLFVADIKKVLLSGEAQDLEKLFAPLPEAVDQVENVLFAISRVILSSDRPVDFYKLYATDVENTGLQLVLTGYINDVKRVRFWDISRDEYRKRAIHELKLSRAVLWQKPVRGFLKDVGTLPLDQLISRYFGKEPSPETVSALFYDFLLSLNQKTNVRIELKEMRNHSYEENQILVYARFTETYQAKPPATKDSFSYPSGTELEYIFIVELFDDGFKIVQAIPFYYVNDAKKLTKIDLPAELGLYKNLEAWPGWFDVEEENLGEFLTLQLNRRTQELLSADERVSNTVKRAQIHFAYHHNPDDLDQGKTQPYFALYFDVRTKEMRRTPRSLNQVLQDEDVLYILNIIFREFVKLIRSYEFKDYADVDLVWSGTTPASSLELTAERLDLFRKNKISVSALFEKPHPTL
jgi:hypothetical protein